MWENMDQKNSEYGHFSRSEIVWGAVNSTYRESAKLRVPHNLLVFHTKLHL